MNAAGPSADIDIITPFSRTIYRKAREIGGEYENLGRDVYGLHNVLKHLKREIEAPKSTVNRDPSLWNRRLVPAVEECHSTLRQVDGLLKKRDRSPGGRSPSSPIRHWDTFQLDIDEKGQLSAFRARILSHKTTLTLCLDTIQLHSSENTMTILHDQPAQLDTILDKVDCVAARMSQRSSNGIGNEKERWKEWREELVSEGLSYDVLQQHKDVLRAYVREIHMKGLPDETPRSPNIPFPAYNHDGSDASRSASSDDAPPSLDSLNTSSKNSGPNERHVPPKLDLKFPQAMRNHIQRNLTPLKLQTSPQPTPDYNLITPDMFENDPLYFESNGSDPGIDSDYSGRDGKFGQGIAEGEVFVTSELLSSAQQSPSTPNTGGSTYFMSGDGRAHQRLDLGLVTPNIEPTPMFAQNGKPDSKPRGRPPLRLAPDSYGNHIPQNAQWTRIKRSLVSPEVLKQEGKRFEANPEYVAVLGVMSREEVQDYATRSLALRETRLRRPRPYNSRSSYQIPRPTPLRNGEISPIPDPNSESDVEREQMNGNKPTKASLLRQQQPYNMERRSSYQSQSGYPNPYGSPTMRSNTISSPAPPRSPPLTPRSPTSSKPNLGPRSSSTVDVNKPRSASSPKPGVTFAEEVQSFERDPSRDSTRRRSEPVNNRDTEKKGLRKKWKENLTVAGGEAASFLHTLKDAAGI